MSAAAGVSRRGFVLGAAGTVLAGCTASTTSTAGPPASGTRDNAGVQAERITYGAGKSRFAELYRPKSAPHAGVVVVIHGGFWRSAYDLSLGRPLARDLSGRGYTCWNLEYRRVGNGGGWPATFDDIAAGIDKLADLDVDTSAVVAVGHSAGGQLAVWAAGRAALPRGAPGAAPRVGLSGVVSQAGVLDLRTAARTGVGGTAVPDLLGGSADEEPARYAIGDPIEQVPVHAPVLCVHAHADANVPYAQSSAYVEAADQAGGKAALHTVPGDHFTLIDTTSTAWSVVRDALPDLFAGRLPR